MHVRLEEVGDRAAVRRVNQLAFGQDDEARLVEALRDGGHARVSLVAEVNGTVVGHILFSDLPVLTDGGTLPALSLAPMAVLPEHQRQGVGTALVQRGLEACRAAGHRVVVVLGHRHFYPRFGFSAQRAEALASPFGGGDAWMALELVPGALDGVRGWVRYPAPFGLGIQVRPVYRPDRAEWVRMRLALWPEEPADQVAAAAATFLESRSFRWSSAIPAEAVFVADRADGKLCGFVEASVRPFAEDCATQPVGYVEGWYVDPDMRRQKVGKKLLEAAERWAAAQGCREMGSDAYAANTVSRAAHQALGFEEGSQVVHFRKRLSRSPCDNYHP